MCIRDRNLWYGASSYSYDFSVTHGTATGGGATHYGYGVSGAMYNTNSATGSVSTSTGIIPSGGTMGGFYIKQNQYGKQLQLTQSNTQSTYQNASWLNNGVTIASSDGGANEATLSNNWSTFSPIIYSTNQKYAWVLGNTYAATIADDFFISSSRYSNTIYVTI